MSGVRPELSQPTAKRPRHGVSEAARQWARETPHALAVVSDQAVLTWADLDRKADQLANAFRRAGVAPGDHVAWLARNRFEFPIFVVAARRARAVMASLNWRLSPGEIAAIINDCKPKIVLIEDALMPLLADVPAEDRGLLVYLDSTNADQYAFDRLLATGQEPMPPLKAELNDPVFLYYTSGTTGKPKGVVHLLGRTDDAVAADTPFGWGQDSINLIVAPVFHLTGSVWSQSSISFGSTQVVSASTTPALILAAIDRWRVTHTVLVPTMVRMVLDEMAASGAKVESLKIVTYGGAPMTPGLLREAMVALGCQFAQGYGLTETNCPATFLNPEDHVLEGPRQRLLASVGRPYLDIKLRVVDPATQQELPAGKVGEVHIHTPWRLGGYRNNPDLTASVLAADGWFRTGDGGYVDEEGYLFLTDRINDMIVTGGENVFPTEVESVLSGHEAVAEAAVFGVGHPKWGETVYAAVVPRPNAIVDGSAIIAFCRERLAHYKCPREVVVVDALPRNFNGKLLRRDLRARFSANSAQT